MITSSPALSVIVPFHDSDPHIASCIESLLAADPAGAQVEFLFVDNGSCDTSAEIVRRYPEVELLQEATPGAYAARNAGLRRARAPTIAFTDADCAVDPHWLIRSMTALEDPQVAIAVGLCRYPDTASRALSWLGAYENAKTAHVLQHCPSAFHFAYANNMAVRASVFAELGPFREWRRAADTELVHRLAGQRPDLRTLFDPTMVITHHEFLTLKARAARLSLYTETNSKIATFRELTLRHRLAIGLRTLRAALGWGGQL